MKRTKLIFILLSLTFYSFQSELTDNTFKNRVESFLSNYSEYYSESTDRFTNSKNNDLTLETKVKSDWSRVITLKKKTSYKNAYDQVVYQRLFMGFIEFKDSASCDLAFSTLLTCLGTDCKKVSWGNELIGIKTTPFIFIKTEKEIIYCKIHCEHRNEFWTDFKNDLIDNFAKPKSRIIEAGCGGPLTFNDKN